LHYKEKLSSYFTKKKDNFNYKDQPFNAFNGIICIYGVNNNKHTVWIKQWFSVILLKGGDGGGGGGGGGKRGWGW